MDHFKNEFRRHRTAEALAEEAYRQIDAATDERQRQKVGASELQAYFTRKRPGSFRGHSAP